MNKLNTILASVAIIFAAVALFKPVSAPTLGGITNYDQLMVSDNIGIATTSPSTTFDLVVGTANATSTIFTGRLCFAVQTAAGGSYVYYYPSASAGNAAVSGWATSTSPCY